MKPGFYIGLNSGCLYQIEDGGNSRQWAEWAKRWFPVADIAQFSHLYRRATGGEIARILG